MNNKRSKILVTCLLAASLLVACGDRERVNCARVKNKAPRAATAVTADTAGVGSARQALEEKCL